MKTTDIKQGSEYIAKISGKIVPVKVLEIFQNHANQTRFRCKNLDTKREVVFRSAQRFRTENRATWANGTMKNSRKSKDPKQAPKAKGIKCRFCNSGKVVKLTTGKLESGSLVTHYQCNRCGKFFTKIEKE